VRQNPLQIFSDLAIPESNSPDFLGAQIPGALYIPFSSFWKVMFSAIDFDTQSLFRAEEIQNVRTERLLAAEFHAQQLAVPETCPELLLCPCDLSAQRAGTSYGGRGHFPLTSILSPCGRGLG